MGPVPTELHQAALAFLRDSAESGTGADSYRDRISRHLAPEPHVGRRQDFLRATSSFDNDDAALMLCYISGRAPVPDGVMERLVPPEVPVDQPHQAQQDKPQVEELAPSQVTNYRRHPQCQKRPRPSRISLPGSRLCRLMPPSGSTCHRSLPQSRTCRSKQAERARSRSQLRAALVALNLEARGPLAGGTTMSRPGQPTSVPGLRLPCSPTGPTMAGSADPP